GPAPLVSCTRLAMPSPPWHASSTLPMLVAIAADPSIDEVVSFFDAAVFDAAGEAGRRRALGGAWTGDRAPGRGQKIFVSQSCGPAVRSRAIFHRDRRLSLDRDHLCCC